jgi:hypothetical protein
MLVLGVSPAPAFALDGSVAPAPESLQPALLTHRASALVPKSVR